jgi:ribosomal protein S18 acetylase RimI-like enzyme
MLGVMASNAIAAEEYTIAPLRASYLPEAARVVSRALPDSLVAAMGAGFLQELLSSYATLPGGYAQVCLQGDRVAGCIVGTEDSGLHRRLLLKHRWFPMVTRAAQGLVSSPRILLRLLKYVRPSLPSRRTASVRDNGRHEEQHIPAASLVLLAVDPGHQRRGIGDQLSEAFLEEMSRRRVDSVKLAVDTENAQAISFYLSRGWKRAGRYLTPEGGYIYRMVRSTREGAPPRRLNDPGRARIPIGSSARRPAV